MVSLEVPLLCFALWDVGVDLLVRWVRVRASDGGLRGYWSCSKDRMLADIAFLSSRGYLNWTNLQEVVDLYAEAGIQLEGIMKSVSHRP